MRVLVTGAAGFLGSHLCEKLCEMGHSVHGIDDLSVGRLLTLRTLFKLERFTFKAKSISRVTIKDIPQETDWIFHLAARADIVPSIETPKIYHQANVNGTLKLLEIARDLKIKRFIYAASSSCYGIPDQYPTPETAEMRPMYPYALTKMIGEQYVMHWAKVYKLPAVSLRLFNVYGPRARTSGTYGAVFGVFLAQLANAQPLTIVGNGKQVRDFTYVADVVDAFIKAAESKVKNECINIGTGAPHSVNDIVKILNPLMVDFIPKRPGEPDQTCADNSKAKRLLGWEAKTPFTEGVERLLRDVELFKDAPLWDRDSIAEATKDWFKYLGA